MTESRNNGVSFDHKLSTRNRYRTAPTTRIGITKLVANEFESASVYSICAQNLKLSHKILKFNMLHHRLIDFVLIGSHLFFRTAIKNIDFFCTKTYRSSTTVHSGETTAQHNNPFANKCRFTKIRLR